MAAREYRSFKEALATPDKIRRIYISGAARRTVVPDMRQFPALEELTLMGKLEHVVRFPICRRARSCAT